MSERIFIGVAWPYANGPLHLGHLAGALLPPDIFARFHRIKGDQVLMVSGSDEHGTPITVRAEQEGKSPQEIVDFYHQQFVENIKAIGISYDLFTRTTTREPLRGGAEPLPAPAGERVRGQGRDALALLSRTQGVPARPVRRGDLPLLWLHGRTGRPVRQLRQAHGSNRVDRPAMQVRRRHSGDPADGALLPEAGQAERAAAGVGQAEDLLAAQRLQLHAQHAPGGVEGQANHPRYRVGGADPAARVRAQADIRLVRRGDRLPVGQHRVGQADRRAGEVAGVVAAALQVLLLHRQGQYPFPRRHLAGDADGPRRSEPALRRAGQRVPQPGGRRSSPPAATGRPGCRTCWPSSTPTPSGTR